MCGREKAKYCFVGSRLCIPFQRKNWIFLEHCNFQIQFHNCLSKDTCFCWYKNFEAELTKLVLLLWGQTKVSNSLATRATGIPRISCSSCVGRGTWREWKVQLWLARNKLTQLFLSFCISGPSMQLRRAPPGSQWSSQTLIVCPSPTIHFIPYHNHWIPSNRDFQICDPRRVLVLSNRLVREKYLVFKTWAHNVLGL